MRGSRRLVVGPRGFIHEEPDYPGLGGGHPGTPPLRRPPRRRGNPWQAVGQMGKMMQVGGNIIGSTLKFGAIAQNLLGGLGGLLLG